MKKSIFDKKMENGSIYPVAEKKAIHPIAIFKDGFGLWRRNFLALSSIYLILYLPVIVLEILFPDPRIYGLRPGLTGLKGSPQSNIFISLFNLLLGSWAFIALSLAINKAADGQACRIMENIKTAGRRFFPYLGALSLFTLLIALILVVSTLGTIAPFYLLRSKYMVLGIVISSLVVIIGVCAGVYFAIRLSLGILASVIEEKGPLNALKRSHQLIKNYVTPVAGEYCLLMFPSTIVFIALLTPLGFLLSSAVKDVKVFYLGAIVYAYLLNAALTPFASGILVALYKKLTEAVDV